MNAVHNINKDKGILALTWPIFIETSFRMSMVTINLFILGHLSEAAVASVGVAGQVVNMFVMMYGVVATGTAIMISQYLGAGKQEAASQIAFVALVANLVFGGAMSLGIVMFASRICISLNLSGDTLENAVIYLSIVGGASFLHSLIATVGAIFRSYGLTVFPMVVALAMNVINIIGSYISIFQPFNLPLFGVKGVATSMVVSAATGSAILLFLLIRQFELANYLRNARTFPLSMLKSILKIGVPSAAESLSYNGFQIVMSYMVAFLGAEALATRVYAQNITTFVYLLSLSIGQGTQIKVGRLLGAGQCQAAYDQSLRSLKIAVMANLSVSLLLFVLRRSVLEIFTHNETIIQLGMTIFMVDMFLELGRAGNHVVSASLKAAGDVRYTMFVNVFSMWGIGALLCYVFGLFWYWGLVGMWLAAGMDEWARALILLRRWLLRRWEHIRLVHRE